MTSREKTHSRAKALIASAGNHIISVIFYKKDGSLRRMIVHPTAIRHRLVGESASASAKKGVETRKANHPEFYPVVDFDACKAGEKKAIRSINLDTLVSIKVDGMRHDFDPVAFMPHERSYPRGYQRRSRPSRSKFSP